MQMRVCTKFKPENREVSSDVLFAWQNGASDPPGNRQNLKADHLDRNTIPPELR